MPRQKQKSMEMPYRLELLYDQSRRPSCPPSTPGPGDRGVTVDTTGLTLAVRSCSTGIATLTIGSCFLRGGLEGVQHLNAVFQSLDMGSSCSKAAEKYIKLRSSGQQLLEPSKGIV